MNTVVIRYGVRQVVVVLALLWCGSKPATSQQVLRVNASDCAACVVSTRTAVTLGDVEGGGIIEDMASWARRLPGGEYLVVPSNPNAKYIARFSSAGIYLGRIGREGQGPGEFMMVTQVQVEKDRIVVFDQLNLKYLALGRDLARQWERRIPVLLGNSVFLIGDRIVSNHNASTDPARVGLPAHILNEKGEVLRSVSGHTDRYDSSRESERSVALAPSGDTAFWTAHRDRYELHLWSMEGQLLRTIVGDVPWFPHVENRQKQPDVPPAPLFLNLQDVDGVLWMLVSVADPDWRDAVQVKGPTEWEVVSDTDYRDTVLHAVDAGTGKVVATHRLDAHAFNFVDSHSISAMVQDRSLIPRIAIIDYTVPRR